jgi:PAS domain S-box-containing protein
MKINISILVTCVIIVLMFTAVFYPFERKRFTSQLTKIHLLLANVFEQNEEGFASAILERQTALVSQSLKGLPRAEGIDDIDLYDIDGGLFFSSNDLSSRSLEAGERKALGSGSSFAEEILEERPLAVYSSPVSLQGEVIGYAKLYYDLLETEKGFRLAIVTFSSFLLGMVVIMSSLLHYMLSRYVTSPVLTLRDAITRVQEGRLGEQVDLPMDDEIGEMASAFNDMSMKLQENHLALVQAASEGENNARQLEEINLELGKLNQELEEIVAERTQRLRESNEELTLKISELKSMEESLRRQNEYLGALHDTALGLISRLDLSDLLQAIVHRAGALIGTNNGFIYLRDPEEKVLEMQIGTGIYEKIVGYRINWGEGLCGRVWETESTMLVDDYGTWKGRLPDAVFDHIGSLIAAPLKSTAECKGVFGVGHPEAGKSFGEAEITILNRFAELASIALENAGLYKQVQLELDERRRAEEALKQSEEKYRAVVDQTTDCIYLCDFQAKCVVEANPAFLEHLGYSHNEIVGLSIYDIVAHEPEEIERAMQHVIQHGDIFLSERFYRRKDGTLLNFEANANVISYGGKEVFCIVCRDITQRKKLEEEMLKAQKLESIGILAGGIAHDFNNIMTAVIGNLSMAKSVARPEDAISRRLEEAEKASWMAKNLTQQLLTFSKGGAPVKRTTSLSEILRDSALFASRGAGIQCRF